MRANDVEVFARDNTFIEALGFRQYLGATKPSEWEALAFVNNEHLIINQRIWSAKNSS